MTLGTDGAISGNDLDLWLALRLAAMLHKGTTLDAAAVTAAQAFAMATREGAAALSAGRLGSLEPGKLADMMLVDLRAAHATALRPHHPPGLFRREIRRASCLPSAGSRWWPTAGSPATTSTRPWRRSAPPRPPHPETLA